MSKKPVTVVCVCAGLALLAAAALWPHLVPSETYWDDKQQAEFTEGLRHAHELEMKAGQRNTKDSKEAQRQELAASQAYRQQQLDKLAQAKEASQQPARICFWLGVVFCALGVLAHYFLKDGEQQVPRAERYVKSAPTRTASPFDMNDPAEDEWIDPEPLHRAANGGHFAKVRQLLAEGHPINAFDQLGDTPLHYAVKKGHLAVVELLLESGADVNAHDVRQIGNTPLSDVAQTCSLQMARLLLKAGADPTIAGWMQMNALQHAENRLRGEGPQVFQLLLAAAQSRGHVHVVRAKPGRRRSQ